MDLKKPEQVRKVEGAAPDRTPPLPLDHSARTQKLHRIGVAITVMWLVFAAVLIVLKWADLPALTLNAWGDFMAGVSAPIALLWLVLGYFQQGAELQQNTRALVMQHEELQRQVAETAALARNSERHARATEQLAKITNEVAAREARAAQAAAQPYILQGSRSGGPDGVTVTLRNRGATVRDVQFQLVAGTPDPKLRMPKAALWERDKELKMILGLSPTYPLEFSISFVDGHGAAGVQRIRYREGGKMLRLSPRPEAQPPATEPN